MNREQVVVAGAGAAGLAVAGMLKRRGVEPLVLERTGQIASSWRRRYDSLRLNTPRLNSTLAGYRMPIPGLWHTGAGAHPLATLNGWSGRTAAREILRATKG